jgi:RNA polymerase sigma factor (sigma-70 family)
MEVPMSFPVNDFSRLMHRAAERDQNALAQLFGRYNRFLLARLRRGLKKYRCLRSRLDPEDRAQDIRAYLTTGSLDWRRFSTPDDFQRYLARTASNCILMAIRSHLGVQKRDASRRHCFSEAGAGAAAGVIADPSPTPAWTAEVRDECERLLLSLTDKQQQVVRMKEAGYSHAEIAEELGCSERTIERMMSEIRRSLGDQAP